MTRPYCDDWSESKYDHLVIQITLHHQDTSIRTSLKTEKKDIM